MALWWDLIFESLFSSLCPQRMASIFRVNQRTCKMQGAAKPLFCFIIIACALVHWRRDSTFLRNVISQKIAIFLVTTVRYSNPRIFLLLKYKFTTKLEKNFSQTESVSVLRWRKGNAYSVGPLRKSCPQPLDHWRLAISKEPKEKYLPLLTWGLKHSVPRNVTLSSI
jgi:hypothetical protein